MNSKNSTVLHQTYYYFIFFCNNFVRRLSISNFFKSYCRLQILTQIFVYTFFTLIEISFATIIKQAPRLYFLHISSNKEHTQHNYRYTKCQFLLLHHFVTQNAGCNLISIDLYILRRRGKMNTMYIRIEVNVLHIIY